MFIITKDYIEKGDAEGTVGPRNISASDEAILRVIAKDKKPEGMEVEHFYMYDGDDVLYYAGYHVGEDPFEPLDCFGMPNAGCTDIHMKNKDGKYEAV
jgi:hypothetical protein